MTLMDWCVRWISVCVIRRSRWLKKSDYAFGSNPPYALSKTVIEQYVSFNKHKKAKPSDFIEVGGPFVSRHRAEKCAAQLSGKYQRKAKW